MGNPSREFLEQAIQDGADGAESGVFDINFAERDNDRFVVRIPKWEAKMPKRQIRTGSRLAYITATDVERRKIFVNFDDENEFRDDVEVNLNLIFRKSTQLTYNMVRII